AYIMVPVYGPTTTRELVGDTIDTIYFPYALLTLPLRFTHWMLDGLGTRAKLIDQERIIDNALDPYALTKDFYLQINQNKVTGRQSALKQEQTEQADDANLDEYMDELDQ
ncbi:MAG: MlaA family lipoprotein, partial [Aeromonas sobria]